MLTYMQTFEVKVIKNNPENVEITLCWFLYKHVKCQVIPSRIKSLARRK